MPKRTSLYEEHLHLNARMVEFGGWEMPVSYAGIIEEHNNVRKHAGLFDIGHMGLIKISGPQALDFIQSVATNDASKLTVNSCQYSILCNENGGTIDDILVYHLPDHYMIIANASNTEKVLAWFKDHIINFKIEIAPLSADCMLSLQGPEAAAVFSKIFGLNLSALKKNQVVAWPEGLLSRTGYTGEDGVEIVVPKTKVEAIWKKIIAAGIAPCGLGARDTLRLEAGLPLYGHEYNDETSPIEAGYSWAVKFDKGEFVGRPALLKQKTDGPSKKLVGLMFEGRQIPRQGCEIFDAQKNKIGVVTSGTFSPTLKKPIALAYLSAAKAVLEQSVFVSIRENLVPVIIAVKSFIRRGIE